MEEIEAQIERFIKEVDDSALELYSHASKGKRLRAKLILKIAGENESSYKLAAIVEMIHAASLLHDDVIDESLTRRGSDSINALYGDKTAIMLGDILYSKGFLELVSYDREISEAISDAVAKLSVGEMMDVTLSENINLDQALYFEMIYKKTAVLIEATAKSAAYLSGKDAEAFALYGKNLGLAFQIIDDVLDITMSDLQLGKPSLADFKEGKTTLPYIYLFESLNQEDTQTLNALYKKELSGEESRWIRTKMQESGAVLKSIELAQKLGYEALEAIAFDKNSDLERVMREMIERDF
ncbi:MAG TPA: polyprenyl synthetase family protein [Campylobacterales bacterium]|nr:polyprenyl synthetase family protein [Campylobacterales bacterium]